MKLIDFLKNYNITVSKLRIQILESLCSQSFESFLLDTNKATFYAICIYRKRGNYRAN